MHCLGYEYTMKLSWPLASNLIDMQILESQTEYCASLGREIHEVSRLLPESHIVEARLHIQLLL